MSAPDLPVERLPVSLLTGFLGSGKTTLLKRMLGHPGLADTAVIINEFGEVGLDHRLVEATSDQTILLESGCLCCTIRDDLIQTLRGLFKRRAKGEIPAFRRVIIESTGLADPAPILHTLMSDPLIADRFRLDGVIATVDAVNGMDQLDRQPESMKQAAVADRLVLTKADIAEPAVALALKCRLQRLNPAAPLLEAVQGAIEPSALLGAGLFKPEAKTPDVRAWLRVEAYAERPSQHGDRTQAHGAEHDHAHHRHDRRDRNRHDDRIHAFAIEHDRPLDWDRFADWIGRLTAEHGESLLRVKGILDVAGEDEPIAIHGVQHLFHPPASLPAWPDSARRSQLVFILRDLEESVIRQGFGEMAGSGSSAA